MTEVNAHPAVSAKAANEAVRLMIFGSCVSRDVLNFDVEKAIALVDYYARSSFASAFAAKPGVDTYSANLQSGFQAAIVKADLEKSLQHSIREQSFDLFLIDLIDERFNVFVTDEGALFTVSNELRSAGFDPQAEIGTLVKSGSEEFFALWEAGWERFVSILKETGQLNKVVVNRTLWSSQTSAGNDFSPQFQAAYIAESNSFLMRLYERMDCDLSAQQFISPPSSMICGNEQHKWGISPFHYVDDYYLFMLHELRAAKSSQCLQVETPKT